MKRYRIRRKTEPPHRRNQSAKMKYLRTLLISAVWQVLLKDGEYSVDADHFSAKLTSGGSSKVKIECQKVIVKNGKATAWINFSSSKYDKVWVKVNGTQNIYHAKPREGEAGVAFEIPVNLNSSMTFMAHTSSMSGKKYCIYDQYCNPGRYSPVDTIHTGSDRYYGIKFQRGI